MSIELTREELFKQVWEHPMIKVAADYGISDVALKKICGKHRIIVPGRGYWAKEAAGKKVTQAKYHPINEPGLNRIVIYGSPTQKLPEQVKQSKAAAKAREKKPENKIAVPAQPNDLVPSVERVRVKLEQGKANSSGIIHVTGQRNFNVSVSAESAARTVAFLNAFLTAAEERGYKAVKGDGSLVLLVDDKPISFSISETTNRLKHVPTEKELTAIEGWERHQGRRARNWRLEWKPRPEIPEWDYEPSGMLQVHIDQRSYSYDGLRRTFGDGKTQRIEKLISPILVGLATCAAAIKAEREERERRRIEMEEARRIREEQQRRNALEKKRIEALSNHLERWNKHQEVLAFIFAVEEQFEKYEYENPEKIKEWIEWAKAYAKILNPISNGLPSLLHFEDFQSWELH